jgi:hypothetical protein
LSFAVFWGIIASGRRSGMACADTGGPQSRAWMHRFQIEECTQ